MDTMQPALKNGRNLWDPIHMPAAEFEDRVEKIREAMKKESLDLLLLYGKGFNDYGDPCYVCNYVIRLPRGTITAVPLTGPLVLFFEGASRGLPSMLATTWIRELKAASDVAKDCVKYLKEKGLIPCNVGLGTYVDQMPHGQYEALMEAMKGSKVVDAGHIVRDLRMIKSPRECDEIRRAGRIVKKAFDSLNAQPLAGVTEIQLDALLRREARLEGAEDVRMLIGRSNESGFSLGPPEKETLAEGKDITLYLSSAFERYWAEGIRTFVVTDRCLKEKESPEFKRVYEAIGEIARAGAPVSTIHRDLMEALRKEGMEPVLDYGLGHGIGLSPQEAPFLSQDETTVLREGMSLAIRLAVKNGREGCLMKGDTFIITKGVPENASH